LGVIVEGLGPLEGLVLIHRDIRRVTDQNFQSITVAAAKNRQGYRSKETSWFLGNWNLASGR
jgi:hypothetical protein